MNAQRYGLTVARSAATAIAEQLPEPVASAVIKLIAGPLVDAPRRVGTPLQGDLDGFWAACRGTFRVAFASTMRSTKPWCWLWLAVDTPTDPWVIPN